MADVFSILSAITGRGTGRSVQNAICGLFDPALFQGSWTGKYANNKSFKITVSNVTGFSRQGSVPERRHQQIPGRPDQGQRVPDR